MSSQQQTAATSALDTALRRARGRGVPLVAVTTPDQPAMVSRIAAALSNGVAPAVLTWDAVRGPQAVTEPGKAAHAKLCGEIDPAALTDFPVMMAMTRDALRGERVVVVVFNAHRYLDDVRCMQGVMNLRDTFAAQGAMLVLMAPSFAAPVELGSDVLVLDDPLPTDEERRELVARVARDAEKAGAAPLTADGLESAIRSTRGLPRFALSQTVSLSMAKSGLDEKELRARFVQAVNATPGLRYEPEPVGLDGIGGLENFKDFARALAGGREPPDLVVRIDEIEKALAGSSGAVGDSSGTSQAILGALLTWMEEKRASGLIALGPPGCLSGDTELLYRRGTRNSGRRIKLSKLFEKFNGVPVERLAGCGREWWRDCDTLLHSYDFASGRVFYNRVLGVISSGTKPCVRLSLSTGEQITLTADHRVLTEDGFVAAGELALGAAVVCRGSMKAKAKTSREKPVRERVVVEGLKYYSAGWIKTVKDRHTGRAYTYRRQQRARLVLEAALNGMAYQDYVHALKHDPAAMEFKTLPADQDVHHKNRNSMDDRPENLEVLSDADHKREHDQVRHFNVEYTKVARVTAVDEVGMQETFDIQMAAPANNFATADGLIVHNSGKSLCSLALGAVLDVPTVTLDVGALKGSLVGQSEANVRAALKTLGALSARTFFLATCNGIDNLPPELRRRFRSGVWFFDLPTSDERNAIWKLYTSKLDIADERPADVGWTGAEIRACCEQAWQLRISPREAAKWIVPVARAAGAQIEALRKSASGRYVSASAPGVFEYAPISEVSAPPAATGRKYDFDN